MTDYQRYINALKKCAKEHENDRTSTGHIIVSDLCRDTANLLEALEQEPKTGHWIVDVDRWGDIVTTVNGYRCDKCNTFNTDKDNYCPNCGARIVEETMKEYIERRFDEIQYKGVEPWKGR